jgi:hypothetical protein
MSPAPIGKLPRLLHLFFFCMVITGNSLLQSCSTTKIVTEYDCANAHGIDRDTTVWTYFWGLKQVADIHPDCDPRYNHLNKVVVKTRPGHVLLSIITLGIVVPQKLSWCCAPFNPTPGTLGQPR